MMTRIGATILAAALALGAPAAFAQSQSPTAPAGSPATKMPSAGDANTGSSGGGNTGTDVTGSTTHNSNCADVRANPSKYSQDIIAGCR